VERLFTPKEIANLIALIGMINLWNRIAIGGGSHLEAA
jgi:alkylhydroperoxidase family enzyme